MIEWAPMDALLQQIEIPGCPGWRQENAEALCPSVHCARCQMLRKYAGLPLLESYIGGQDG